VCDVGESKVIITKPKSCVCSIDFKAAWKPCPSKINKWQLVLNIPLGTNLLKNEK
jgi:hypothetical protein